MELFSEADDKGYDDVVQFIRDFLQRADVVALLDATISGNQPATSYYHSSIDRKEEAEREVMQAVIHHCASVDEDAASAHTYTQRRSSMNKKGNSCSSSGSREEDEDDITMQLSEMLKDMNLEFDDMVQTFSKTPGKETPRRSSRSGNDGSSGSMCGDIRGSSNCNGSMIRKCYGKQGNEEGLDFNHSAVEESSVNDLAIIIPSSESMNHSIML